MNERKFFCRSEYTQQHACCDLKQTRSRGKRNKDASKGVGMCLIHVQHLITNLARVQDLYKVSSSVEVAENHQSGFARGASPGSLASFVHV